MVQKLCTKTCKYFFVMWTKIMLHHATHTLHCSVDYTIYATPYCIVLHTCYASHTLCMLLYIHCTLHAVHNTQSKIIYLQLMSLFSIYYCYLNHYLLRPFIRCANSILHTKKQDYMFAVNVII